MVFAPVTKNLFAMYTCHRVDPLFYFLWLSYAHLVTLFATPFWLASIRNVLLLLSCCRWLRALEYTYVIPFHPFALITLGPAHPEAVKHNIVYCVQLTS